MPLLAVDGARGTFDHQCSECGLVRRGLRLDPGAGDLRVAAESRALVVRSCPTCRAHGVHVVECCTLTHTAFDAQEEDALPPDWSLVGAYTPHDTRAGGVVREHHIGTHHDPFRVQQARLTRQMQRHPLLAPHAPLHEHWLAAHPPTVHDHDALDGMPDGMPSGMAGGMSTPTTKDEGTR
jgi:hypothetical protein